MQSNGTHVNRDCEVPAGWMNYKKGETFETEKHVPF